MNERGCLLLDFFPFLHCATRSRKTRAKNEKFHSSVTTLFSRVTMNSFYALNLLIHLHFPNCERKNHFGEILRAIFLSCCWNFLICRVCVNFLLMPENCLMRNCNFMRQRK